jgi:hypothetical protein
VTKPRPLRAKPEIAQTVQLPESGAKSNIQRSSRNAYQFVSQELFDAAEKVTTI